MLEVKVYDFNWKKCKIGPNVVFGSSNHSFETIKMPIISQGMTDGEIIVNDDVDRLKCCNLPNCNIGKG